MSGFTLIEILVAFTIAAGALAVVFELLSGNMTGMARTQARERAVLIAQSRLDAASADTGLAPGVLTGRADAQFQWQVTVEPFDAPLATRQGKAAQLYRVVARVVWHEGLAERAVMLQTLRPARLREAS